MSRPLEASVTLLEATTPVKLPTMRGLRIELEHRIQKGGISTLAPRILTNPLHSLPPILHIHSLIPLQSYSKGAWGLSV